MKDSKLIKYVVAIPDVTCQFAKRDGSAVKFERVAKNMYAAMNRFNMMSYVDLNYINNMCEIVEVVKYNSTKAYEIEKML